MSWGKKKHTLPPAVEFGSVMAGRLTDFTLRFGWWEVYEHGRFLGIFDGISSFEDWCRHLPGGRNLLAIFRCTDKASLDPAKVGIVGVFRWQVRTVQAGRPEYRSVTAAEGRMIR